MSRFEEVFLCTYNPVPHVTFSRLKPHEGYKLKTYAPKDVVYSIRREFEDLYSQKYTHVANMPGNFQTILRLSSHFGIICLDRRLVEHVADLCSQAQERSKN